MSAKKDKELQDAYEKLETISGDEELRRLAELRLKYILDQNTGLREERRLELDEGEKIRNAKRRKDPGQKKEKRYGIEEGIIKTAKNLLKLGIPIEQIMKATNLTKEEIQALKEEIPLEKIGKPQDIAKCVKWLINDEYTTGQIISINGGWVIT